MEAHDYDAAAGAIKIKDITSVRTNRKVLRKLKNNDPNLKEWWVTGQPPEDE